MPPPVPLATYRLQLNASFGFDDAAAAVPYLQALGISHLYASPFLKARAGSNHGYDVVDYGALNPELGGEAAFERLCKTLHEADIGLILDFVPNHMAIHGADNSWWLDVLEWGPASSHAASFDIDWRFFPGRPRVLLPILGNPYGQALANGEIELRYDAAHGSLSAWYYEHRLPIAPACYIEMLHKIVAAAGAGTTPAGRRLLETAKRYQDLRPAERDRAASLKAELIAVGDCEGCIGQGLCAYRASRGNPATTLALHELLEQQHYRLAHWRLAGSEINYRRFFDINTLAGLRVEHRPTFGAVHALVQSLIARNQLQGLRIDHIDGLFDPHQYFRRLDRLIKENEPKNGRGLYIVIEKVLADREPLPHFAGVAGSTGYECLNTISRVLLDDGGLRQLDETWRDVGEDPRSFEQILIEAKQYVIANMLASEFAALLRLLAQIAAAHYETRDYISNRLRHALVMFILHFPVYRTYVGTTGPNAEDRATIEAALEKARFGWVGADKGIFDFLTGAFTLELIRSRGCRPAVAAQVRRFASKVQQFTGPMMAKSLEDTAFYRYHRLLALNEVGGDPAAPALSIADFHERMQERALNCPHGLTATATHDTKRGEDARARLIALSELAEEWARNVQEWRQLNAELRTHPCSDSIPSCAHEYMIYQALLAAWPPNGPDAPFLDRMVAYAIKAAREGKQQTSWLAPNDDYEAGLGQFLVRLLDASRSARFIESFNGFVHRVALLGALNGLSQVTLKITLPGVPDFYQGSELWDLSLVDPDNRRPVDLALRASVLQAIGTNIDWRELAHKWSDGRIKLAVIHRLLALRRQFAEILVNGSYQPLEVGGPHRDEFIAFARMNGRHAIIVVCGRLFGRASDHGRRWPSDDAWNATIYLRGFSELRNLLARDGNITGSEVDIAEIFHVLPVAILHGRVADRS
jgi:(1->4)-alpha-D-glucan 1-alpha-D-glucosylmutase